MRKTSARALLDGYQQDWGSAHGPFSRRDSGGLLAIRVGIVFQVSIQHRFLNEFGFTAGV
jgi:hypothetical protein